MVVKGGLWAQQQHLGAWSTCTLLGLILLNHKLLRMKRSFAPAPQRMLLPAPVWGWLGGCEDRRPQPRATVSSM